MSIATSIRSAIKTIDKIGKSGGIQAKVSLRRFITEPGQGNGTYSAPIKLDAFVDWKQQQVRTMAGVLTVSRAAITFTDKAALMKATNNNGIGNNDRITLPDGDTGQILDMGGYIDPIDGTPFACTVYLG